MPSKPSDKPVRVKGYEPGDRVLIRAEHPWEGYTGELIAYETYGLGWKGWRVKLQGCCGECYANPSDLEPLTIDPPRRKRGKGK